MSKLLTTLIAVAFATASATAAVAPTAAIFRERNSHVTGPEWDVEVNQKRNHEQPQNHNDS